jgi:hypothetical protein
LHGCDGAVDGFLHLWLSSSVAFVIIDAGMSLYMRLLGNDSEVLG